MVSKKAFTLVELIVVVTILAVLSTVGFVAFSWYLEWVRDTNRVSQLKNINDGLTLYLAHSPLPIPDDRIEIRQWDKVLAYQWYAWDNILSKIEYSAEWLDPKDAVLFTYSITAQRKSFAMMAFLEEEWALEGLVFSNKAHASLANRIPYLDGRKVWILLDDVNNPIQENTDIQNDGYIDILDVWENYFQLYLSNDEVYSWTWSALRSFSRNYDCKRLKDMKWSLPSGLYWIDPDGDWITTEVYCDMDTDWGGWTITTMLADTGTENLFSEENLNQFITSKDVNVATRGRLNSVWTDERNRDIYLQCFSDQEEHTSYETPFIIYDFQWEDKENLTKNSKAWTSFSSVHLSAKWWNKNFTLNNLYNSADTDENMEIVDTNWEVLFLLEDHNLSVNNSSNINSPAYNLVSNTKSLWGSVYCLSAIR